MKKKKVDNKQRESARSAVKKEQLMKAREDVRGESGRTEGDGKKRKRRKKTDAAMQVDVADGGS